MTNTFFLRGDGHFVAAGGRGNLVGSFKNIGTIFLAVYGNWQF